MGTLFSLSKSATSIDLEISEILLLLFGVLLVIGLIGEYAKTKRWKKYIRTFEMFVIVGVAGELIADGGIFLFSRRLQAIADLDLAKVTKEAGDAATSAQTAHDLGTDLLEKYKSAEREIIDLKAARLPRRLSSAQKVLLRKKVAVFRVKNISISCIDGGNEAFEFAQDFVDAFRSPQSLVHILGSYPDFCIEMVGGSVYSPPIRIEFGDGRESDADTLLKALVEIGVSKKQIAMTHANSNTPTLGLTVGPKAP